MNAFQVELEVFNGPLDLLLTLVRRESLDITTVALARVTGQYLGYLSRLVEVDAGALASFCEVAATLMLIKSRALLPRERQRQLDDEVDAEDVLLARLEAYRRLREVADELGEREREGLRAYARVAPAPPELPPKLDPQGVAPVDLAAAFERAMAAIGERQAVAPVQGVRPHRVGIAERLRDIRGLLRARSPVSFHEILTGGPLTREFVIVTFLAVLELLRRGAVRVVQDDLFGEIMVATASGFALDDEPDDLDGSTAFDGSPAGGAHEAHEAAGSEPGAAAGSGHGASVGPGHGAAAGGPSGAVTKPR